LSDLLSALRDPSEDAPTAQLASLILGDVLGRRLADVLDTKALASSAVEVLANWIRSPVAEARLLEAWGSGIEALGGQSLTLGEVAPEELRGAIEQLAAQHYSPDRELVSALLDRPPVREVFRDLLTETLTAFGKKMSVAGPAGGALGALGKISGGRRPMGGLLGRVGDVATAVGGEVERQLERRVPEFVDSGLSQLLERFVDLLSDPARAVEQAEVRLALLDGLWDLRGADLAAELARLDEDAAAAVLRKSLGAWLNRDDAEQQVAAWLDGAIVIYGDRDVRSVLAELDLADVFEQQAVPIAHQAALRLFETDAFEQWLKTLVEG